MEMTTNEIVRNFREAKNKRMQISILADLNVCTVAEIRDELVKGGVDWRELPRARGQGKKPQPKADASAEVAAIAEGIPKEEPKEEPQEAKPDTEKPEGESAGLAPEVDAALSKNYAPPRQNYKSTGFRPLSRLRRRQKPSPSTNWRSVNGKRKN